jgi:signal transduction histidine kinase
VVCRTREEELATLEPFFREGLDLGERCMYLTADAAASKQALAALDTPRNALAIVAREEVFPTGGFDPERVLDWVRTRASDAMRDGYAGLRLAIEAIGFANDPKAARFPELEARFNHLMPSERIALLCVYDRVRLPPPLVRDMLATHALVVVDNDVCKNPHYIAPEDFLAKDRPAGEVEHFIAQLHASQRADNARKSLDARRRGLSRNTLEVLELERRSIARALQDDVGQTFTTLQQAVERGDTPAQTAALFAAVHDGMTALQRELRPPGLDDLGLVAALRSYATREARRGGFELVLVLDDLDVDRELATACFRIAQEALANIVRHARASRVEVSLQMISGKLDLVVRDDGVGFDTHSDRPTFGLLAMTERAELVGGTLDITSAPGGGTSIRARL